MDQKEITASSRTFPTIIPYHIEAQGSPLTRPRLAKPSKTTADLVNEIFEDLTVSDGRVNNVLIKNKLTLCPRDEDLLLIEDGYHYNLLQKAVILGDVHVVEILIDHSCDVNGIKSAEVCGRGLTPCPHDHLGALHLACFLGHLDVVQYLLEKGADPCLQMKVYTSMTAKDAETLQSDVTNSMQLSEATQMISQCGRREAAFYAVLKNNVPIVKFLLQRDIQLGEEAKANNSYLLHLACHVEAYESFEYLLELYPSYVNTRDADGRSLLLMALRNDIRFVKLLLEQGCDLPFSDDCWRPQTEILHQLFSLAIPYRNLRASEGLSDSVKMCLKMGAYVNSYKQPFLRTPLHNLVETLNFTPNLDVIGKTDNLGHCLRRLDKELMECVYTLVNHGADLSICNRDDHGKTPLQAVLLNRNHFLRYDMAKKLPTICLPKHSTKEAATYGLENNLKTIKIFVERGAIEKRCRLPIIAEFVRLFWPIEDHNMEMLAKDSVFEIYKEILKILLSAGADPDIRYADDKNTPFIPENVYANHKDTPLFQLLICFEKLMLGHFVEMEIATKFLIAQRLAAFIGILISHGACTEPRHLTNERMVYQPKKRSCFNMLTPVLLGLRDQPQPAENLKLLHTLVTLLFQHGVSANLFKDPYGLYYSVRISGQSFYPGCPPLPERTFLFQYLKFGMDNLAYVNDGPWYYQLFDVLYSQIDHKNLYLVLGLARTELGRDHGHHTKDCLYMCGRCGQFSELLDSVLDKPRTLKRLARLVIYNSLSDNLETKLAELPLPNAIKKYIMNFED